jgi:23S rRNA (cytidine1920-2'-O)/16S rRNA (cytidine1409-2'-O)-methyltransferase
VGYGQLAWSLRRDSRVTVLDRTNVRDLAPEAIGGPVELTVADLSFISLRLVLDALIGVTNPDGDLALMVKPQFEVGKERLGKGGVVRDPGYRAEAVLRVAEEAAVRGWGAVGVATSPLPGPSGNVEFFLWLRFGSPTIGEHEISTEVSRSASVGEPGERL